MCNKKLVAYFSCGGDTGAVAKQLARAAQADIFQIKPKVPYTDADLDWRDKNSRTSVEMRTLERPEIAERVENMDEYSTVFVGFPIWWYLAPTVINGFSGKTVVPFATSGGSELGKAAAVLKPLCSAETQWKDGKLINGDATIDDLRDWLKELGLE